MNLRALAVAIVLSALLFWLAFEVGWRLIRLLTGLH